VCFRRSREGNPITSITPIFPTLLESIPSGYTVIERSVRNRLANFNSGNGDSANGDFTSGAPPQIFIAFRQRLESLEPFAPSTLVKKQEASQKSKQAAYFASGGSGVAAESVCFSSVGVPTTPRLSGVNIMPAQEEKEVVVLLDELHDADAAEDFEIIDTADSVMSEEISGNHLNDDADVGLVDVDIDMSIDIEVEEDTGNGNDIASPTPTPTSISTTNNKLARVRSTSNASFVSDSVLSANNLELNSVTSEAGFDVESTVTVSTTFSKTTTVTSKSQSQSNPTNPNAAPANLNSTSTSTSTKPAPTPSLSSIKKIFLQGTIKIVSPRGASHNPTPEEKLTVLTPLLTSLYNLHGGASLVSLTGLVNLITTTSFFDDEFISPETNTKTTPATPPGSSFLIDLCVRIVTDSTTSASREVSERSEQALRKTRKRTLLTNKL